MLEDVNPSGSSNPRSMAVFNSELYFQAFLSSTGAELFKLPLRAIAATFDTDGAGLPALNIEMTAPLAPSVDPVDLTVLNQTTAETVPPSSISVGASSGPAIASFNFPGLPNGVLPDGRYTATLHAGSVTDASGHVLAADTSVDFFVLTADANHDATVDTIDFNILAANFSQSGKKFSEGDFNYDASVDTLDFNLLVANFGKTFAGDAPKILSALTPVAVRPDSTHDENLVAQRPAWYIEILANSDDPLL